MKLERPLVVLDLETTGTWIEKDKIVEIAMIRCLPDGTREDFHCRVNPGIQIPKRVSELIGITNEDIKDKPKFREIAQKVRDFIGDADLAGYNIDRFDLPLLLREFQECGIAFEWKGVQIYDAQVVYHMNEKRDLSAAYKFYCDKVLENAHSAMADTIATLEILEAQTKEYSGEGNELKSLQEFNYKTRPEFYDEDRRFRWWNGHLYPMFGKYAKRQTLEEISQKDSGYLHWILSADFNDEVKALVHDALDGKFPKPDEDLL